MVKHPRLQLRLLYGIFSSLAYISLLLQKELKHAMNKKYWYSSVMVGANSSTKT
jgi:hypothetical protein